MGTRVPVDGDLVVADEVLAVVEVLECGANPMRIASRPASWFGTPSSAVASGRNTSLSSDQFFVSSARQ